MHERLSCPNHTLLIHTRCMYLFAYNPAALLGQALQATYPEDGAVLMSSTEAAALAAATAVLDAAPTASAAESAQQAAQLRSLPQLSGALVLQGVSVDQQPVCLKFTMPAADGDAALVPRLQVECACDRWAVDTI